MELTPQQVLELARKWQLDPVAEKQDLDQEDNKKISVLRNDELAQIQEITKLNVSQTDFNHAFGWIVAEGKILDFIEKEFQNQSNPELLEQLKREKDLADKKKTTWEKHHQKNQQRFQNKTSEEEIKTLTDQNFKDELTPQQAQPTGGKREIPRETANVSTKTSPERRLTKVQVGVHGGIGWVDWLRHPIATFKDWWGNRKIISGINQLSGLGKTNVLSGVGKVNVLSGTGKKAVVGTVAKTGFKAALTKLGAFIPTGVTQAIAIASTAKDIIDKFIPKELQEKLKDLWSKLQIGAAGLAVWLLMNWGALIGGVVGGIIGASAGALIAPFLGPLAPLAPVIGSSLGFTVGAFVGYSLQGIASSILGLGGGSAAGGVITGAGAAPVIPATISVGGFTLPAGLSTAASSFGALLSGTGLPTITLFGVGGGVGLVSIFTALTVITVGATQQPEVKTSGGPKIAISVKSEVDKKVLANNSKDFIKYKVIITSQSDKDVEISAPAAKETLQNTKNTNLPLPKNLNPYPSKITPGGSVTINYQDYEISDDFNNSDLVFAISVTVGTETETASSLTRIGNPTVNNDWPFGYPTSGRIARFEDDPEHRGTFFNSSGGRYWVTGGIDIINAGGTPVYSTVNGTVIYSGFDYGDSTRTATSCSLPSGYVLTLPFNYCAVGGVVIVKSGNYIVSFLHLREQGLAKGTVTKGQIIGYMYDNPLPTSDTHHLHYQILLNGANVPFGANANNSGAPCTPEKIWPEIATKKTISQDGPGPFVCQ